MRRISLIVAGALVASVPHAFAQDQPATAPADSADKVGVVVEQAVEAFRAIDAASYHVRLSAGGAIAAQAPSIEGDLLLQRRPGAEIPLVFRGEGVITAPGGQESQRFRSAYNGDLAFGVDFEEKTLYSADISTGGLDLLSGTLELIIDSFVVEEPLAEERDAFSATLLEQVEINGVVCNVVEFQYAESPEAGMIRWSFGVDDHLPRRIQRVLLIPAGEATITYDLSELNISPEVGADAFTLSAPDGFEARPYDTSGLLPIGSAAPAFTLNNDDGEEVSLADLKGKVVVLDFWATWCGPCIAAMPGIEALHEEFRDQPVEIIGVNCWEQGDAQAAIDFFRNEQNLTYGLLLNGDSVANAYQVTAIPTFYVIGPDGSIVYRSVGAAGEETLRRVIAETIPAS